MAGGAQRPAPVEARVAGEADLEAVAETLARAFHADPVWSRAFAVAERGPEPLRAAWRLMVGAALPHGWVWMTAGATAASLWIPPGKPELGPEDEERFVALVDETLGAGAAAVLDAFERFEAAHPRDRGPHYYLSLLGTDPDHRGRGLGMGLLADNLARLDAEGAAAYLESTNPVNVPRYERLGFARFDSFELGWDGPEVAQMWREPAPSGATA